MSFLVYPPTLRLTPRSSCSLQRFPAKLGAAISFPGSKQATYRKLPSPRGLLRVTLPGSLGHRCTKPTHITVPSGMLCAAVCLSII